MPLSESVMPSRPIAVAPPPAGATVAPLRSVRILKQLRERIRLRRYSGAPSRPIPTSIAS